ncbi:flagellar basal body rod protein FlgB [uncultured Acetobacterium sp.]|uniref:flagellar basal body rod protein FlgB n=1 Tax=uncultured Acetobacterium sp. TaxID=217139 RepID=UPI0024257635|nr:flagellar basal body rod protein FlgB [uncultured Acetobacterium sp.]MBU4542200.1 flagellar basal body rod protein FlgB [Bacillota bacterium]MDP2843600.1 flagellar basal body rod protein FlgB [Acetobacterium sp.]
MIGDSITSALYQKALDGTWQKQKATSNNIANAETPGYKAIKVNFENSLKAEINKLQTTANASKNGFLDKMESIQTIDNSNINVYQGATSNRLDRNNVDMESENIDMTKSVLQYNSLVRGVSDSYSRLKYAINGGR